MAKIFFDANYFIDTVQQRKDITLESFLMHQLFISPLSVHILAYTYKYKIPSEKLTKTLQGHFTIIPFDLEINQKALAGPTSDFEDNVQLHSAAEGECDVFLTDDKKLLSLKFFGKTQLLPTLKDL